MIKLLIVISVFALLIGLSAACQAVGERCGADTSRCCFGTGCSKKDNICIRPPLNTWG